MAAKQSERDIWDMWHTLRIALWVGVAAFAVAAVSLTYLLTQNSGSRNIALATGALAGGAILLWVQLGFELRANESTDFITAGFTIDPAKPEIRQWKYGLNQSFSELTYYVTRASDFPTLVDIRRRRWAWEPAPSVTAIVVSGLARPEYLIEIEAVAVDMGEKQ